MVINSTILFYVNIRLKQGFRRFCRDIEIIFSKTLPQLIMKSMVCQ